MTCSGLGLRVGEDVKIRANEVVVMCRLAQAEAATLMCSVRFHSRVSFCRARQLRQNYMFNSPPISFLSQGSAAVGAVVCGG